MAEDKMIYPIGFDLEKGVKEAGEDWEKKYAKRLEDLIAKRPINVKLKLDPSKLDSLDAVKKRLAELKIEPITPETKTAIKELAAELRTLAKALEAVEKYSRVSTRGAVDASKVRVNEERAKANAALAAQRAARAEYNLAAARDKDALAATRGMRATQNLSREYKAQDGYISRLIKRLAVYAGYRQITGFLDNVRKVTAEFELQRVSLGAIIQDQQRANALFSEIKSFALKSPVSILDLTKYTKQLAAYKIGVDELFETTKKLTDVSVGLGVSMDRVVLAYGQTRATGYLRASEIRQFTEMGVPIVEELAAKLSKMNGELVTAAQVMDMVSKRAISFELVKEVFDDMTSAGGMFYNMQEKQGNTLFGLWAKLGDAASVMYDEIGNTDSVNSAMKGTIQLLTDLMKNWREVGRTMGAAAVGFAALWSVKKVKGWQSNIDAAKIAANEKYIASSNAYRAAIQAEQAARATATAEEYRAIAAKTASAEASYTAARAEYLAARNTTLWSKAWGKLKTAFLGNWMTLLIAGLTAVGMAIYNAYEKGNRLKNALADIDLRGISEQSQSVSNFKSLADMAVKAADGSKQQRDALDELHRTYSNMIPVQDMTIEKLRALNGEYHSLTDAIKEYIAQQNLQEKMSAIYESYGKTVKDATEKAIEYVKAIKVDGRDIGDTQARRIINNMKELIESGKNSKEAIREAFTAEGLSVNVEYFNKATNAVGNFTKQTTLMTRAINKVKDESQNSLGALGRYAEAWETTTKSMASFTSTAKKDSFLYTREKLNRDVGFLNSFIKDLFKAENLKYDETAFAHFAENVGENGEEVSVLFWDKINQAAEKGSAQLKRALEKAQDAYYKAVPSDQVINLVNAKIIQFTTEADANMDKMRSYWLSDGADISDVAKNVKSDLEGLIDKQKQWNAVNENAKFGLPGYSKEEMDSLSNEINAVQMLLDFLQQLITAKGSGRGAQSDPRLGILQEMVSTLKQVNKEYDELAKKEGATKAHADTQRVYADTFKNMQQLAAKYKFDLPDFGVPTDAASLTKYLKAVKDAMAKLPKSDKAVLALQVDIEKLNIDDMQKKIEKKLKELSDIISRTKTAKEFYDRILSATGDAEIAATLTMNVYGNAGEDLFQQTVEQIQTYFSGVEVDLPINFDTQQIDYKSLRKLAERMRTELGEAAYKGVISIADNAEKDTQKMIEGWLKATEKAKTYGDKLADVYRTTATEIERIQKAMAIGDIDKGIGTDLIAGYQRKQAEEIAKLQYEAFKDSPMYVQMFDDLDHASTRMLDNMRDRLIAMQGQWKNLDPTQLKELQSRLNEIDKQLAQRNPFKTLADGIREYYKLRKEGDARGNKNRAAADIDVLKWTDAYTKAQEKLAKVMADKNATMVDKAAAQQLVNLTKREKEEAEKAAENWKKVEDAIGLSANELMSMLNWAGDIARAVADISEALGADEEDVQYWNTVADSLSDIASGIQDIVSAAMSGNVVGVVSSVLTAIPKMFVGFVNLFNAGRIRKANKEIKRQQNLLEQLQYTYSRLEKVADRLFGTDYINNFKQQERNLQAQAEAYRKQAEAERSKGKKADEAKIKEYENAWRDTMNEIADMQSQLIEKFTGTSKTDVAKQMAQSWLEARASLSDTYAAIYGDYSNMIKNMIVEGAAARLIENALTPMWDKVDAMLDDNNVEGAIDALVGGMDDALTAANNGMEVLWKSLEARGYDMKKLFGDVDKGYTGIKRDVAGATSEEMNANTAALNTQNYYMSQLPGMAVNLAAIRQFVESGNTSDLPASSSAGWTDWQQQAMDNYVAIQKNTADTVVECRRVATACESYLELMRRVVKADGGRFVVKVGY